MQSRRGQQTTARGQVQPVTWVYMVCELNTPVHLEVVKKNQKKENNDDMKSKFQRP